VTRPSLLLLLTLTSCATSAAAGRPASRAAAPACDPAALVHESLLGPGAALLFGEFHGTVELPAFFAEAVCHASMDRPVLVGLEVPGSEQPRVTVYLASGGEPADRAALLAGPFWTPSCQDGRGSEAMLGLIERLRALRAAGRVVDIALFDVELVDQGPRRDELMARNLVAAMRAHPDALTLAFMGNLHARTVPGAPWNPQARFLGWYLRDSGMQVKALNYTSPPGTAWSQTMKEGSPREPVCGPTAWGGLTPPPARAGITLLAQHSPEGFDGTFTVMTLTASPPAASSL
jgi:hypothetical protein